MKIGILGGSFNPCHQGHLYLAKLAIKKLGLSQVWVCPTRQNPLKIKNSDYDKKLHDCQEFFGSHPKIKVKDIRYIYAIDLIEKLRARNPGYKFFWVMGSDNLEQFHLWKSYSKLLKKIPMAIFVRKIFNNDLLKLNKYKCWKFLNYRKPKFFFTRNFDLSSSKIRKKS